MDVWFELRPSPEDLGVSQLRVHNAERDEPWRPEGISGSMRAAVDAPVTMLERIDDAIFSLNVAFDRAGENFEMLRCGVTVTDRESHSEHDQRPGR